jgi:hypothetical protein
VSEWISVKEKLPEPFVRVLARYKAFATTPITDVMYIFGGPSVKGLAHDEWRRSSDNRRFGPVAPARLDLQGVTHWMPITDPPAKESA